MLVLDDSDGWLTLREATDTKPAVEARFLPPAPWMKRRAAQLASRERSEEERELEVKDLPLARVLDIGDTFSLELCRLAIVEWRGVGDREGAVVEVTPPLDVRKRTYADEDRPMGTVDQFLAIGDIFEAADRLYVQPQAVAGRSKNGSAASPNGTGEAGTQDKTTASSPAETAAVDDATSAPTSSTSPTEPPKSSSGKSSTAASAS